MATNSVNIGVRIAPDLGVVQTAAGGGGPAFTPRGLWFTRVIWWPIIMAGGSTFLAGCTALLTR